MIKHLILLKLQNLMDINVELLQSLMHVDQSSRYAIPTRTGIASDDQQLTKELHKQIIRKYKIVSYACPLRKTFG